MNHKKILKMVAASAASVGTSVSLYGMTSQQCLDRVVCYLQANGDLVRESVLGVPYKELLEVSRGNGGRGIDFEDFRERLSEGFEEDVIQNPNEKFSAEKYPYLHLVQGKYDIPSVWDNNIIGNAGNFLPSICKEEMQKISLKKMESKDKVGVEITAKDGNGWWHNYLFTFTMNDQVWGPIDVSQIEINVDHHFTMILSQCMSPWCRLSFSPVHVTYVNIEENTIRTLKNENNAEGLFFPLKELEQIKEIIREKNKAIWSEEHDSSFANRISASKILTQSPFGESRKRFAENEKMEQEKDVNRHVQLVEKKKSKMRYDKKSGQSYSIKSGKHFQDYDK